MTGYRRPTDSTVECRLPRALDDGGAHKWKEPTLYVHREHLFVIVFASVNQPERR